MRTAPLLTFALVTSLGLGACGADDDVDPAETSTTKAPVELDTLVDAGTGLECPAKAGKTVDPGEDPTTFVEERGKPEISVPDKPATKLCTIDTFVGTGDPVVENATVTGHYVLAGQKSGKILEASWDTGVTQTVALGETIAGWGEGIVGMRPGGQRIIVLPAELAWGDEGIENEGIAPGETIVVVYDLMSFTPPEVLAETGLVCPGATGPNSAGGADVAAEIDARGKPVMTVPDAPATELCFIDEIVGTGAAVPEGATIKAHYVGVGQQTRKQFDSSWERGAPTEFSLGGVIPGWTQGIPGMKVGGRRTLVIPGELAYGSSPGSPDILPNETLIFTIDLVAIV